MLCFLFGNNNDTIELITNEFARIFALDNDYIQSASLLEKSLIKILDDSENEIASLSGQINSCMLLWDYEKEGYYTYKLIANDDACEECSKLSGKELSIKEFSENEFFPLVHPNCKCRLQIINENGEDVTFIDEIPPHKEKMSLLDQISNFLAVASFIPGFDTFTNFASIPVDLLRGDFLSAGLDVIGVIPVIGEAADIAKTINKANEKTKSDN